MPISISGTTGITLDGQFNSASSFGFKNRILNGGMVIDQRNAGASVTGNDGVFSVDRWVSYVSASGKFTMQQSSTAPAGFKNSVVITSSAATSLGAGDYYVFQQTIEGYNVADLGFGASGAATVTVSFWVRSSLTGTFGGSLKNTATGATRSYPFTYTISSANTWEQKTVTVAGDTTGTWGTTNSNGLCICFGLGVGTTYSGTANAWAGSNYLSATGSTSVVGTSGATWYVSGVQFEKGSTATSFDYRPIGTELQLCQRYYESTAFPDASFGIIATRVTVSTATTAFAGGFSYLVPKRTNSPTVTLYSRNNNSGKASLVSNGADIAGTSIANNIGGTGFWGITLGTAQTAGTGLEAGWTAAAEL